jgi:hypothetical protein
MRPDPSGLLRQETDHARIESADAKSVTRPSSDSGPSPDPGFKVSADAEDSKKHSEPYRFPLELSPFIV